MIIGVDFDGTCVRHEFPAIGEDAPGAVLVLRRLVEAGHKLILYTMRSDRLDIPGAKSGGTITDATISDAYGLFLTDAVAWFTERGIELWGVNENPEQGEWTTSPKAYCHLYIDDAALGVPLRGGVARQGVVRQEGELQRPFVDWLAVEDLLEARGVLTPHSIRQREHMAVCGCATCKCTTHCHRGGLEDLGEAEPPKAE